MIQLIVPILSPKLAASSYKFSINISQIHKPFNHNNVKFSHSSLPYFASITNFYNKKTLKQEDLVSPKPHNCRVKESCPLTGDCLQSSAQWLKLRSVIDHDRADFQFDRTIFS